MSEVQFLEYVRRLVVDRGGQKTCAAQWGVSEQYLCDVLKGRRKPAAKLLKGMGWCVHLDYQPEQNP